MEGVFYSVVIGILIYLIFSLTSLVNYKQEAFDRGFMVECLGKSGYYWECDE
jgi:hypothetical protein